MSSYLIDHGDRPVRGEPAGLSFELDKAWDLPGGYQNVTGLTLRIVNAFLGPLRNSRGGKVQFVSEPCILGRPDVATGHVLASLGDLAVSQVLTTMPTTHHHVVQKLGPGYPVDQGN